MYRIDLLALIIALFITYSYASPFFEDREKRPFCNGYFGCRNGKRSMESTLDLDNNPSFPSEPQVKTVNSKRPFCNGFRGCANGKRSLEEDTKFIDTSPPKMELAIKPDKRPFCNGFRGCANGKRSNVLDRDQLWFLQKLLENISRQDMRERGPYESGASRRKRRSTHKTMKSSRR